MQEQQQSIVSPADHMAGFKEVTVTFRSGERQTIRIVAPSRKQTRELPGLIKASGGGLEPVIDLCLAQSKAAEPNVGRADAALQDASRLLDRLTMESAAEVELVCLVLTFGDEFYQKKILPVKQAFVTYLESIEAKLFADATVTSNGKSTVGATPSSPSSSV